MARKVPFSGALYHLHSKQQIPYELPTTKRLRRYGGGF